MKSRIIGLPAISDYVYAVANPHGLFRTLGEVEPEFDAHGNVCFYTGGNAVVFPVAGSGRRRILKCYLKKKLNGAAIYSYVSTATDDLLAHAQLLEDELYVYDLLGNGAYHDVVLADMVEGVTLETMIKRTAREFGREHFRELSEKFDMFALSLLGREWAHGDLKPDNIIVCPDGGLRLIDYDAMFIPAFSDTRTSELGTPSFQHPARDETYYRKSADDYPAALISVSLRALSIDPELYAKYNRADNIILDPRQVVDGASEAYGEILSLFSAHGEHDSYRLAGSLRSPAPEIEGLAEMIARGCGVYPACRAAASATAGPEAVYGAKSGAPHDTEECHPELFERDGLWGFNDAGGAEVIPSIYEAASPFSEGLAAVSLHGMWHYVEPSARVAISCGNFSSVKPFSENLAAVLRDDLWGYIDRSGRTAIEPQYETAGTFRNGRALVKTGGRYGFIDPSGSPVIAAVYEYATGFRDGKASVYLCGEFHEIGPEGQEIV